MPTIYSQLLLDANEQCKTFLTTGNWEARLGKTLLRNEVAYYDRVSRVLIRKIENVNDLLHAETIDLVGTESSRSLAERKRVFNALNQIQDTLGSKQLEHTQSGESPLIKEFREKYNTLRFASFKAALFAGDKSDPQTIISTLRPEVSTKTSPQAATPSSPDLPPPPMSTPIKASPTLGRRMHLKFPVSPGSSPIPPPPPTPAHEHVTLHIASPAKKKVPDSKHRGDPSITSPPTPSFHLDLPQPPSANSNAPTRRRGLLSFFNTAALTSKKTGKAPSHENKSTLSSHLPTKITSASQEKKALLARLEAVKSKQPPEEQSDTQLIIGRYTKLKLDTTRTFQNELTLNALKAEVLALEEAVSSPVLLAPKNQKR